MATAFHGAAQDDEFGADYLRLFKDARQQPRCILDVKAFELIQIIQIIPRLHSLCIVFAYL